VHSTSGTGIERSTYPAYRQCTSAFSGGCCSHPPSLTTVLNSILTISLLSRHVSLSGPSCPTPSPAIVLLCDWCYNYRRLIHIIHIPYFSKTQTHFLTSSNSAYLSPTDQPISVCQLHPWRSRCCYTPWQRSSV